MNTASKASNLFEAFFGIHEMLPWQNWIVKAKKLHEQVFKSNIGMNIFPPVSKKHHFTITITKLYNIKRRNFTLCLFTC